MIVSPQEYNSLIHRLRDPNEFTAFLRIPDNEPIYEVNLSERKIYAPEFLSVEKDHNSEIIWFTVDRFYDNIDLYDSTCWIQYVNAEKEQYFYAAPLIVGIEKYGSEKLLIPWAISKEVAAKSGNIQFSFQFFKLSEDNLRFLYTLNTMPANSKILNGLRIDPMEVVEDEDSSVQQKEWLADELHRLTEAYETLAKDYELYWLQV